MKIKKFLALLLLVPLSFVLFACGEPDEPKTNPMTFAEIKQSVLVAEQNSKSEIGLSYEFGKTINSQRQSQSDSLGEIVISRDNLNLSFAFDDEENYLIDGYTYSKYKNKYDVTSVDEVFNILNQSFLEGMFNNIEKRLNKDYLTFSSVVEQDETYKATITFNFKKLLNNVISDISTNREEKLCVVFDALLEDLGYDFTSASLVEDLKQTIDVNTTLKMLIEHYEQKFNVDLSSKLNFAILLFIAETSRIVTPEDYVNFYNYDQFLLSDFLNEKILNALEMSKNEFDTQIQALYDNYLNNEEVTISSLMQQIDVEECSELVQILYNVFCLLDKIQIEDFKFEFKFAFDKNKVLQNAVVEFNAGLTIEEEDEIMGYDVNAVINVNITDVNATTIVLPNDIEFNSFSLDLKIDKNQLNENQSFEIICEYDFVVPSFIVEIEDSQENTNVIYANYNSQNKTLTLTQDLINEFLEDDSNNTIVLYDSDCDVYIEILVA